MEALSAELRVAEAAHAAALGTQRQEAADVMAAAEESLRASAVRVRVQLIGHARNNM